MQWLKVQQLRRKSKAVRNQIALSVASVCTAIVFTVWVFADPAGVSTLVQENNQPRPFGGILEQISEQVAGARAAITGTEESATNTTPIILPNPSPATGIENRQSQIEIGDTESSVSEATTTSSMRFDGARIVSTTSSQSQ